MRPLLFNLCVSALLINVCKIEAADFIWVSDHLTSGTFLSKVNCTPIKLVLGVDFSQLDVKYKPNITKLELEFKTTQTRTYFNLSTAAPLVLQSPDFKKALPTVIVIHGFLDTVRVMKIVDLTQALVTTGGKNVFALSSSSLLGKPFYMSASTNVAAVGEMLGKFLHDIVKGGVSADNIHLIGHSLGSHISSYAAKTFMKLNGGAKIGRISGLDPAGPCFFRTTNDHRLTSNDAKFVDVIHTSTLFGYMQPSGHIDTYPNNGERQEGCLEPICSHQRALDFYKESVLNPTAFKSVQCSTWENFERGKCEANPKNYMGYYTPRTAKGIFFLRTNSKSPFSKGDDGIKKPWWKIF